MKKKHPFLISFIMTVIVGVPSHSFGDKKKEYSAQEPLIVTGVEDSIKTSFYMADSGNIYQEVAATEDRANISFKISQIMKDTACTYQIEGIAKRIYHRNDRSCIPSGDGDPYRSYLVRKSECIVDIRKNSKWLKFSTSNCVKKSGCPTESVMPMHFSHDTVETRWIEMINKNIKVPPR